MKAAILVSLALVVALPPPVRADDAVSVDDARLVPLRQRFAREPSIRDVQQAAARHAGAHPALVEGWLRRVRKAPWLPLWRADYQYVSTDDQRLRVGADVAPLRQQDVGAQHRPGLRLQWELDRLIFDPQELRVAAQAADLARLREAVVDRVTRVYFERRRLLVQEAFAPLSEGAAALERELRCQELAAAIDALTGGVFPMSAWSDEH